MIPIFKLISASWIEIEEEGERKEASHEKKKSHFRSRFSFLSDFSEMKSIYFNEVTAAAVSGANYLYSTVSAAAIFFLVQRLCLVPDNPLEKRIIDPVSSLAQISMIFGAFNCG